MTDCMTSTNVLQSDSKFNQNFIITYFTFCVNMHGNNYSSNNRSNPERYSSARVVWCVSVDHLDTVDDGAHTNTQCAASTLLSDVG